MAETLLITKDDIREYWPISKNMNNERVEPYILRAQQRELKPFLGEQLYYDFVTNILDQNYQDLLNGVEYNIGGGTIYFNGIKPLLAAFSYGQLLRENPVHVTRAGNKNKTDENSTEVTENITWVKSKEAVSEAIRLQAETGRFLDKNKSDYPLWLKGVSLNEPTTSTISLTKVPRSIQR